MMTLKIRGSEAERGLGVLQSLALFLTALINLE